MRAAKDNNKGISDEVAWQLLDIPHSVSVTAWMYLMLVLILSYLSISCMHNAWAVCWSGFGVCVIFLRLLEQTTYKARRPRLALVTAQRQYMAISIAQGTYWGFASLVMLLSDNRLLQFWIINALTAVLTLTIARGNAMKTATHVNATLSTVPCIICFLLTGNGYYQGYALAAVMYLLSTNKVITSLNAQTVDMLVSKEHIAALLETEALTNAKLDIANRYLTKMATTDGLTGIPNRRCFDDSIRAVWEQAARARTMVAILLIDIDQFKTYNDTFGHLAGDACLRSVAQGLAGVIRRPGDLLARYGGEEFVVLITDTAPYETFAIAERLRIAVTYLSLPGPGGVPVSVSIGGALCQPAAGTANEAPAADIAALIATADANLYTAKRAGRNRVWGGLIDTPRDASAAAQ